MTEHEQAQSVIFGLGAELQAGDRVRLHVTPDHKGYPGTIERIETGGKGSLFERASYYVLCDKGTAADTTLVLHCFAHEITLLEEPMVKMHPKHLKCAHDRRSRRRLLAKRSPHPQRKPVTSL